MEISSSKRSKIYSIFRDNMVGENIDKYIGRHLQKNGSG